MAVAEELHFGRAAQRLHMTQPPLSQQVRLFEERVGVQLIERSTRAVRLTAAGAVLRDALQRMMNDGEAALANASRVARGEAGHLRVGFTPTAAFGLIPAAVRAYRERHPQVHLTMIEGNTTQLQTQLQQGRLDVAILRRYASMRDDALRMEPIHNEPMIVAVPAQHPLAGRPSVAITELVTYPLVGFARQTSEYFHNLLNDLFFRNEVIPHYAMESLMPTLLALVEAGIGVALVPASSSLLRGDGIRYLPLEAKVEVFSTLHFAYCTDSVNPALPDLRDALIAAAGQLIGAPNRYTNAHPN